LEYTSSTSRNSHLLQWSLRWIADLFPWNQTLLIYFQLGPMMSLGALNRRVFFVYGFKQ
jgi:hypothetical protein